MKVSAKKRKVFRDRAVNFLANKFPHFSAKNLRLEHKFSLYVIIMVIISICVISSRTIIIQTVLIFGNIIFLSSMSFKILLNFLGLLVIRRNSLSADEDIIIDDESLPLYSILIPLYREENILCNLIASINNLDYPQNKLEIFLLLEEDDNITINALKTFNLTKPYQILLVPYCDPRTKPKACNYGLNFAKGEYITIYDAEDIPDRLQLKKIVSLFEKLDDSYICIQAKLNYYNREENLLSKFFSLEYSIWFEFMLPALYELNFIIPLGGTSNHFRRKALIEVGAWDPYNVTEDAELGVRLRLMNYKTKLINSVTLEESPIQLKSWTQQRIRWIKGYMQTYIIALLNRKHHLATISFWQIIGFHFFIGLPALTYLVSPIILVTFLSSIAYITDLSFIAPNIILLSKIILLMGITLPIISAFISMRYNNWRNMYFAVFTFSFYWILHSFASYMSVYELFFNTYYWNKTPHGISKFLKHGKAYDKN